MDLPSIVVIGGQSGTYYVVTMCELNSVSPLTHCDFVSRKKFSG